MKVVPGVQAKPEESDDDTVKCGIAGFKPAFLQRFASPKAYLVNYCILGILQGAYFTYIVGVMSTLEKRYAFESKISGVILIADNLSPIILSLLIGFYGGKSHRPRLIFGGMLVVVLSCFLSALPYFIFGPGLHLINQDPLGKTVSNITNRLSSQLEFCDGQDKEKDCKVEGESSPTVAAVFLIFFANFLNGFGYTAFYTIGTPYLDDNVKKKDSPLYLSTMFALRIFGPSFGFMLSSFTLRFYEDPFYDPGFTNADPRWVGAWWMGFLILGALLLIFTLPMVLFPRRLPSACTEVAKMASDTELPKLRELPKALSKLARNPILVCHTISITLQINGFLGYYVSMSKYMESQYRQTASSASMYSGSTSILTMLVGIMVGGVAIHRFKPRPKILTGYMVGVEMFTVLGFLASMFLGCPPAHMEGISYSPSIRGLDLNNACNMGCGCTLRTFTPVCGPDGRSTYFSPCYAGCTEVHNDSSASALVFTNCSCITQDVGASFDDSSLRQATRGYCPLECNMFLAYIIVLSLSKMISSTARVGNTLITLRCIDIQDKSLAIGAMGAILSVFAFIPYPLIFGALMDAACLIWEKKCGKTGNCWLYDTEKFRYYLHGTAVGLITAGVCFDVAVFFLSGRLSDFYSEKEASDEVAPQAKEEPPSYGIAVVSLRPREVTKSEPEFDQKNGTTVIPL